MNSGAGPLSYSRAVAIDLRSDTVTRPTPAMLAAMASAETGDDVYAEDPTVRALEERVASMLGHEAGLFTVTGSLANMLGVRTWVGQGRSCCARRERTSCGRSWVGTRPGTASPRGPGPIRGAMSISTRCGRCLPPTPGRISYRRPRLPVENTHNFAGGTVQPLADLRALRSAGRRNHCPAAPGRSETVERPRRIRRRPGGYGELFDTVSVCLSKGLGAPIGSVLLGPADAIAQARQWRKRMGAGWRQAGVLAAAGLYALDHHLDRLADDHANAAMIAGLLAGAGAVDPDAVETNIVMLELTAVRIDARQLVEAARAEGVLAAAVGPQTVRLITHLDVTADDCRKAAETLASLLDHSRA